MRHVVTFGEMLLRLSPPGDLRLLQAPSLDACFGGCEANVAVGLAQFGIPVEYVTCLPENPLGDAAVRALRSEGVGTRGIVRGGDRLGLYFLEGGADLRPLKSIYDRKYSSFAQCPAHAYPFQDLLQGAARLHVSGIVAALGEHAYRALAEVMELARAAGVQVSFDLNFRPALWSGVDPQPVVTPLLRHVDLLIGNPGALAIMAGVATRGTMPEPAEALHDTARRVHERFGCRQVAITQREVRSSSVHAWQGWWWQAGADALEHGGRYEVQLTDRVGGGDAFVAGLLAALEHGLAPADAVRFGTAACALKHTVAGDFPRTTRDEVSALVDLHRHDEGRSG